MNNMKAQIILFASAVMLVCSCQKENLAEVSTAKNSVVATIAEEDTKTTVNGTDVKWKEDDQIAIAYYNSGTKTVPYKLDNTYAGQKQGVFTGEEISFAGDCYAVYPYSIAGYKSGVKFDLATPSEQTAGNNVGQYMPMYTEAFTMGDKLNFKHVSCALKITINPSTSTKINKIVVARKYGGSDNTPSASYTIVNGNVTKAGNVGVNLQIDNTISEKTDYYIAVAPKSGGTWTITVTYKDSETKSVEFTEDLQAGKLYTGSFNL